MKMEQRVGEEEDQTILLANPQESLGDGEWLRGRLLGEGGFGEVHLAHFPPGSALSPQFQGFPSLLAVKSVALTAADELMHERELYEVLGQSPFLIRCFGKVLSVIEDGGWLFNVFLEYASGGDLFHLIEKSNGLGLLESQVRGFTCSILSGIKHIHEAGYVHCDVKPENVLLVEDGDGYVAKIGDLGLTKSVKRKYKDVRGTAMFLAPECYEQGIQGQASDIWALGCVVLSMLTGRMEWEEDEPIIPRNKFSKEAEDFVRKCLSTNPSERPTAATLLSHPFLIVFGASVKPTVIVDPGRVVESEIASTFCTKGLVITGCSITCGVRYWGRSEIYLFGGTNY